MEALLAEFRPGPTPLRLDLTTAGARGALDANGRFGVRADPDLLNRLRALGELGKTRLVLARPQQQRPSAGPSGEG